MIAWLVVVPAFAAALRCRARGFRDALVTVGLPTLLLLPTIYRLELPGLPDANFFNYAFAVLLAALLRGRDRALVAFHPLDLPLYAYGACLVATEWVNKDGAEARNMAARFATGLLAPYFFGRAAARRDGLLVAVVGVLVGAAALYGVAAPYEARMGASPFDWMRGAWPHAADLTRALYRNGLRRVEGPFSQPICLGLYFTMALPLLWWLYDARLLRRAAAAAAFCAAATGLALTQARGPLTGAVVSLAVAFVAGRRSRRAAAVVALAVGLLGAGFAYDYAAEHWFVTRAEATTESQHSAAYRFEMLQNYMEYVDARPLEGYGRNRIPVVAGQDSIDNQYLFTALCHGLPAAWCYLAALLGPAVFAAARAAGRDARDPLGRLAFTVAGALFAVALVQASVYAGTQTEQVQALLQGLAVGLGARLRPDGGRASAESAPTRRFAASAAG